MFGKKTISEKLDEIQEKIKISEELKLQKLYDTTRKSEQRATNLIDREYCKAKLLIGNRLTITKGHSTYYVVTFEGLKRNYQFYMFASTVNGEIINWRITESSGHTGFQDYSIELKNLSEILKKWVIDNLQKDGEL